MAAGMFRPGTSKIPVKHVTVETYRLFWSLRHRIAPWAIMPLILCAILLMVFGEVRASGPDDWHFRSYVRMAEVLFIVLATVPYQVFIHRLAYPGFDFDTGSYGPAIGKVYRSYFGYTFLLAIVPAILSYLLLIVFSYTLPAFIYYQSHRLLYLLQLYILLLFVMIFPAMAVGVKPDLLGAFWLLRGNRLRAAVVIILTTIIPIALAAVLPYFISLIGGDITESDLIGGDLRFQRALYIVLSIVVYLVTLGLWACCVSLCYYHVTNCRPLPGSTVEDEQRG